MKSKAWHVAVLVLGLMASGIAAAASPSVDDIYQAARAGRMSEAQTMVEQVLAEHPKSAKAHYVAAEIYAKEGKTGQAKSELQTAEQLEPGLPFAKPQSVNELKSVIGAGGAAAPAHAAQAADSGFPWGMVVMLLIAIGVIVLVVKAMSARNQQQVYMPNGAAPGAGYPAGGGYGYGAAPQGGGLGSSIVGGLATGAAIGAGMVAGEALAHHFLDGDKLQEASNAGNMNVASNDLGGSDFGISNASSWDDSSTSVADFSSGDVGGGDWT